MADVDLSDPNEKPADAAVAKANQLLDDAANRRGYRRWSFLLAVAVVLFFGLVLYRIACAIVFDVSHFSPWIVGIFATMVVAMSVLTLALLRATFASPEVEKSSNDDAMPQMSLLSDALKTVGEAVDAVRSVISK